MNPLWLAAKAFAAPILSALGRVFGDPRVILALVAAAALWATYAAGRHVGKLECETAHKDEVIAGQSAALAALNGKIADAQKVAAKLAGELRALHDAADAARKDIANVLPPPDADHGCDLPPAARGVLNRSSGYAD
jgi:hypothetical protein